MYLYGVPALNLLLWYAVRNTFQVCFSCLLVAVRPGCTAAFSPFSPMTCSHGYPTSIFLSRNSACSYCLFSLLALGYSAQGCPWHSLIQIHMVSREPPGEPPWGGGGKEGLSSLCMTTDTQSSHKNFFKSLSASVPTQRVLLFDRCPWMFFSLLLLSFPLPWCVFQKARVRMLSQMKARVAYSSSPVPSCSRGWFYAFSSERTPELP